MRLHIKILLTTLFFAVTLLGKSVATITAIKGDVSISTVQGITEASLGDKLDPSDRVLTADNSMAQIIFNDETIVTLGKNSNFYIKKYLYTDKENSSVKFNLLKGAIRTITGKIGKMAPQKFKIATKTATIGIRGTNFTVFDGEDGTQQVYCTYGAVDVGVNQSNIRVNKNYIYTKLPSGKLEKKAFSAEMLMTLNSGSFLDEKDLRYALSQESSTIHKAYLIDNITQDVSRLVKKKLNDATADEIGVEKYNKALEEKHLTTSMYGWGTNNQISEGLATLSMQAKSDGSGFDPLNSYVVDTKSSNEHWTYTLQETPINYTSKSDFSTAFVSATSDYTSTLNSYSNYQIDPAKNYFKTVTDLSSDDYMSWGEWGATVNYTITTGSGVLYNTYAASRSIDGLWIGGELTPYSVIAGYNQTFSYSGEYRAYDATTNLISGMANMSVDFGVDQATLTINSSASPGTIWRTYDMTYTGTNHLVGSSVGGGSADGNFYGPTGNNIGGNFIIKSGTTTDAKGVYEVSTTDALR